MDKAKTLATADGGSGGPNWWLESYYRVYLLQGGIALLVASPIVAAFYAPGGFNLVNFVGVLVWAAGFVFELVADVQLARFKARPESRGRIMNEGLWGVSRHPNYFGDALQWWGLGLVALTPWTWWALIPGGDDGGVSRPVQRRAGARDAEAPSAICELRHDHTEVLSPLVAAVTLVHWCRFGMGN